MKAEERRLEALGRRFRHVETRAYERDSDPGWPAVDTLSGALNVIPTAPVPGRWAPKAISNAHVKCLDGRGSHEIRVSAS